MRRLLVALGSLLLALSLLPQGHASADTGIAVLDVRTYQPSQGATVLPSVRVSSSAKVAKVTVKLRLRGETEPYATHDASYRFVPIGDSMWWRTPDRVSLKPGRTYLDVEVTGTGGERVVRNEAAFADAPDRLFDLELPIAVNSEGKGATDVTGRFGAQAKITHERPVQRVEARLYRAGTNEQVAEFPALRRVSQSANVSTYQANLTQDPPIGDYDIVVTAWDEQGDRAERRSPTIRRRHSTKFAEVATDRSSASVEHPSVVVTGRLLSTAPDGSSKPVSGMDVHESVSQNVVARTDADGRFRMTWQPDLAGPVQNGRFDLTLHAAQEDDQYVQAVTTVKVDRQAVDSRVSVSATGTRLVGDKATLSGLLEGKGQAGRWLPLAGRPLKVYFDARVGNGENGYEFKRFPITETRTGADGRYRVQAAVPRSGNWVVVYDADQESLYRSTEGSVDNVNVHHPTVVDAFTVTPDPVGYGAKLTARGRVLRPRATGSSAVVTGGYLALEYSADGKTWSPQEHGYTNARGEFSLTSTATKDGRWRIRFYEGSRGNASSETQDAESFSSTEYVDVRYRTAFTSFNAAPEPVKKGKTLTVSGKLTRNTGKWVPSGKGAKVTIYFQAKGSKTWKAVGTTTTDAKGAFKKGFKASQDGTWKAVYAGSTTYLNITSGTDYVDVR